MKFDNIGRLIVPKDFIRETKKERELRKENERRERDGKIRKKDSHFGDPYPNKEIKEILLINNCEADTEDIALKLGRTTGAIQWILDHRDYYEKYGKIKTSNDLQTDSFIQQVKRVIDSQ